MTFDKIGKGEALVWTSGAIGAKAAFMLAAAALNITYAIPEVGFAPFRRFYPTMFVVGILLSYVAYRVGVSGERPRKAVSLWFSGALGMMSASQLVMAVMGWSIVVPQYSFVYSAAYDPLAYAATWMVATLLCGALWLHARKDGAAHHATAKSTSRKRRR